MSQVPKVPLGAVLQRAAVAAAVLAAVAVVVPDPVGAVAGAGALTIVVAAPLGRVGWLAWTWRRERDTRFTRLAAALLAVVAAGTVAGVLT